MAAVVVFGVLYFKRSIMKKPDKNGNTGLDKIITKRVMGEFPLDEYEQAIVTYEKLYKKIVH